MADPVFVEEGEYYCWCFAQPEADGTWTASVTFERRSHHRAGKSLIPAVRHVLDGKFDDEKAAISVAIIFANHQANFNEDGVGLD